MLKYYKKLIFIYNKISYIMGKILTGAEQINKYELTAEQVLAMLNLNPNEYMAEKNYSSAAVKAKKKEKEYANTQLYEWEIYHKVNGKKGNKVKWKDMDTWINSQGLNLYATGTKNGIVIYKPFDLAKKKGLSPRKIETQDVPDDNDVSSETTSLEQEPTEYEVIGGKGNDEEIVKHIAFIKVQLLKECYEATGILL